MTKAALGSALWIAVVVGATSFAIFHETEEWGLLRYLNPLAVGCAVFLVAEKWGK